MSGLLQGQPAVTRCGINIKKPISWIKEWLKQKQQKCIVQSSGSWGVQSQDHEQVLEVSSLCPCKTGRPIPSGLFFSFKKKKSQGFVCNYPPSQESAFELICTPLQRNILGLLTIYTPSWRERGCLTLASRCSLPLIICYYM